MSRKPPGKGTWWPPLLLELQNLGLKVKNIEGFDYKRFFEEGESYVKRLYRPETAEYYLKHSNLMETRPLVPAFMQKVDIQDGPATFEDLDSLVADGWLVGIDLNAAVLNGLPGRDYVGHMVVIFDSDQANYWLHDPGLPPHRNRRVDRKKLADAWFWSGPETAGLVAFKLNEDS